MLVTTCFDTVLIIVFSPYKLYTDNEYEIDNFNLHVYQIDEDEIDTFNLHVYQLQTEKDEVLNNPVVYVSS